uniref:(northern house mosquito) hypothetical protein n=1 Tax=Culex pipiens TaxID=7175 RepID=A0A8D8H4W9_CULPI
MSVTIDTHVLYAMLTKANKLGQVAQELMLQDVCTVSPKVKVPIHFFYQLKDCADNLSRIAEEKDRPHYLDINRAYLPYPPPGRGGSYLQGTDNRPRANAGENVSEQSLLFVGKPQRTLIPIKGTGGAVAAVHQSGAHSGQVKAVVADERGSSVTTQQLPEVDGGAVAAAHESGAHSGQVKAVVADAPGSSVTTQQLPEVDGGAVAAALQSGEHSGQVEAVGNRELVQHVARNQESTVEEIITAMAADKPVDPELDWSMKMALFVVGVLGKQDEIFRH